MHIGAVLSTEELERCRSLLAQASFFEGAVSASGLAARNKHNREFREAGASTGFSDLIKASLLRNTDFLAFAIPQAICTVQANQYSKGMYYGSHVDAALINPHSPNSLRVDLSVTVFLSDIADYDGGELEVDYPDGLRATKLAAGWAAVYRSDCIHRVTEVSRGCRIVAVTWVQSHVRDHLRREELYGISKVQTLLQDASGTECAQLELARVYNSLLRSSSNS